MSKCKLIGVSHRLLAAFLFAVMDASVESALDQINAVCLCCLDAIDVGGMHGHAVVDHVTGKQRGSP
jgi:hypothetical protein